jgi:undecaprenyl-diphosphatase
MMDTIYAIEKSILLGVNGFNSAWGDVFISYITGRIAWIPMYLCILWVLYKNLKLNTFLIVVVSIALAITLSDQICGSVLRHMFGRLRPSNLDNPIHYYIHIIDDHRGGEYGMPSCHASNTVALFVWILCLIRKRLVSFFLGGWVLLECYSRMYAGVHYPGDLLCGLILGSAVAFGTYKLSRYTILSHPNWYQDSETILQHKFEGSSLIAYVGLATIAVIAIWATISVW